MSNYPKDHRVLRTSSGLEILPTYIAYCCREWVMALGFPRGHCGICGKVPEYLREDDEVADGGDH